jgi:hypothetical protein
MSKVSKLGIKLLPHGWKTLLCTAACLTFAALVATSAPKANAQVSINIGGPPPVCPYGYYDYAPYSCAPVGFYGPGYFYNGIFLGVGPWRHWGYRHGWGSHRFVSAGGGRYRPRPYRGGAGYGHGRPGYRSGHVYTHSGPRPGAAHAGPRPGGGRPGGNPGGGRPVGGHSGGGRPGGGRPGGGHNGH